MVRGIFVLLCTNVSFVGRREEGGDRLRLRKAWDVPPSSIVRSKVRVAWTLAATLEVSTGIVGGLGTVRK